MTSFDLIIVGSGPAELAAASHAQSNGLSYALLERTDHLADTIDAYQARKYVMAEPMLIPARGEVPFVRRPQRHPGHGHAGQSAQAGRAGRGFAARSLPPRRSGRASGSGSA